MFLQYPLPKCIGQYVKSKYSLILIRGLAATWERILQTLEISTLIGGFTQVGQTRSSGANTMVTTFPQLLPNFSYQISQNSSLSLENYFCQWKSVVFPSNWVSYNIFHLLLVSGDNFPLFWEIMWRFQFSITAASKRIENGCGAPIISFNFFKEVNSVRSLTPFLRHISLN